MIQVIEVTNNEVVAGTGELMLLDDIYEKFTGSVITFSGEPFNQSVGLSHLASMIKLRTNKTIVCKTDYVFEDLVDNIRFEFLLNKLDILVENQRIIDVQKSLLEGKVVLYRGC